MKPYQKLFELNHEGLLSFFEEVLSPKGYACHTFPDHGEESIIDPQLEGKPKVRIVHKNFQKYEVYVEVL